MREDAGPSQEDCRLTRKCLNRAVRVERDNEVESGDIECAAQPREKIGTFGQFKLAPRFNDVRFLALRGEEWIGELGVSAAGPAGEHEDRLADRMRCAVIQ